MILRAIDRIETIIVDLKRQNPDRLLTSNVLQQVDLVSLLGQIIEEKGAEFRSKGLVIDFSSNTESVSCSLLPQDFAQAISDIIDSSVEAVSNHAPMIKVKLFKSQQKVFIELSDNGPGVSEALLDQLFDRGFKSEEAGQRNVGLAQAKLTIRSLGGDLYIDPKAPNTLVATIPLDH